MSMVVWTFLALAVTVIIYAWLGQGGGVSGLIFFGVLLIGGIIRVFGPKPETKQLPQ
jgi:hypothetical protein